MCLSDNDIEMPEAVAWMMKWPSHSPSFTTDKSDYVSWFAGRAYYAEGLIALYTADQLRAAVRTAVLRERGRWQAEDGERLNQADPRSGETCRSICSRQAKHPYR